MSAQKIARRSRVKAKKHGFGKAGSFYSSSSGLSLKAVNSVFTAFFKKPAVLSTIFSAIVVMLLIVFISVFFKSNISGENQDLSASVVPFEGKDDAFEMDDTEERDQIILAEWNEYPEPAIVEASSATGDYYSADDPSDYGLSYTTGAGLPVRDREKEVYHVVQRGETLSEIASMYRIDLKKIIFYNGIDDADSIHFGSEIVIPSYAKEASMDESKLVLSDAQLSAVNTFSGVDSRLPVPTLDITTEKRYEGTSVTVHFSIKDTPGVQYKQFVWDLGNRRWAYKREFDYIYDKPGTYSVTLTVKDKNNRTTKSNEVYIDVPYPASYKHDSYSFLTINNTGDTFDIPGYITEVRGFSEFDDIFKKEYGEPNVLYTYQALKAGYYALTIQLEDHEETVYLFVSPVDSVHNENNDLLWYRTQIFTGTKSNCGPSTVSMGIAWATGQYVPVINIREFIGWRGDGGTSFGELVKSFREYGVTAYSQKIRYAEDLFSVIDSGDVAIVLFDTAGISESKGNPEYDFFGKHYEAASDSGGHYGLVKGYSKDHKYLIVQDSMPSNWSNNSGRYNDGVSMLGRNRYYSVSEMNRALNSFNIIRIEKNSETQNEADSL